MINIIFNTLTILCLTTCISYSQINITVENNEAERPLEQESTKKQEPHKYGGWYCPDNLNGFPAVDINKWENVPVVNGRMATKEETHNGASLIFVDAEEYPNAKALDITMPKLASFYNRYSKREDLVIVIQAINVNNDSVVGFRYLNGGNGSARLNEVKFLSENEIEMIPQSRFVSHNIKIEASQDVIWEVLTTPGNAETLQHIFDTSNKLKNNWRETSNVNYHYPNSGTLTSAYAGMLFGNFYIQNDYDHLLYNEKFLLLENIQTKITELKIVCGPFGDDFETQQNIINNWAQKVKALSETNAEKRKKSPEKYIFVESKLNELGYYYLGNDELEKAIAIFKLNVDAFPYAFNVYDSYGEVLLIKGAREEAIENYKKSVKLNPGNENGIKVLKELGVSTDDLIVTVPVAQLKLLTGEYIATNQPENMDGEWKIVFEEVKGELIGTDRGYRYKLLPVGDNAFVNPDDGASLIFNTKDNNSITLELFRKFKFKKVK